jgi:hypothetical protein
MAVLTAPFNAKIRKVRISQQKRGTTLAQAGAEKQTPTFFLRRHG